MTASAVSDDKVCPRCAETVKAAAAVCRYCGFDFEIPAEKQAPGQDDASENLAFAGYILAILVPFIGLIVGLLLLGRGRSKAGFGATACSGPSATA